MSADIPKETTQLTGINNATIKDTAPYLFGEDETGALARIDNVKNKKRVYFDAWRTSNGTYGFQAGQLAYFNTIQTNTTLVSKLQTTDDFSFISLTAGYSYTLKGDVCIQFETEGTIDRAALLFRWHKISPDEAIGAAGVLHHTDGTGEVIFGQSSAEAQIDDLEQNITIGLKCEQTQFIPQGVTTYQLQGTKLSITIN
ncbi:MAG: hypothetical protein AAGE99_04695 [Chlamydiota bacterium]